MPPDYSKGKIYKIECLNVDDSLIYIGATTREIKCRLAEHKCDYKRFKNNIDKDCTSFRVFEQYGVDNVVITLIENVNCENKEELTAREREWIRALDCVNKIIPGRTREEYYKNNKTVIDQKNKEWKEKNAEKYKETCKEYTKIYEKTEKRKESKREYEKTEKRKEYKRVYNKMYQERKREIQNEIKAMMLILI